jgi:hypothetical protein
LLKGEQSAPPTKHPPELTEPIFKRQHTLPITKDEVEDEKPSDIQLFDQFAVDLGTMLTDKKWDIDTKRKQSDDTDNHLSMSPTSKLLKI